MNTSSAETKNCNITIKRRKVFSQKIKKKTSQFEESFEEGRNEMVMDKKTKGSVLLQSIEREFGNFCSSR